MKSQLSKRYVKNVFFSGGSGISLDAFLEQGPTTTNNFLEFWSFTTWSYFLELMGSGTHKPNIDRDPETHKTYATNCCCHGSGFECVVFPTTWPFDT